MLEHWAFVPSSKRGGHGVARRAHGTTQRGFLPRALASDIMGQATRELLLPDLSKVRSEGDTSRFVV
jgi:hypothetical protein